MGEKKEFPACPVETTLTLIGNKWKVLILRDLLPGKKTLRRIEKIDRQRFTKGFDGAASRHGKRRAGQSQSVR